MLVVGSPNVVIGDYGGPTMHTTGSFQSEQSPPFQEGFVIVDELTGKPVAGLQYRIYLPDGSVVEGKSNERGRTMVVGTNSPQDIRIEVDVEDDSQ